MKVENYSYNVIASYTKSAFCIKGVPVFNSIYDNKFDFSIEGGLRGIMR
jgi:hypothetical protein